MQESEGRIKATLREVFLLLTSTLVILSPIVVSPALPDMGEFFSSIPNAETLVKLVITIPALSIAIAAPFVGLVIDKWGRRKLLIGATALYGVSGTVGFFLRDIYAILVCRAFLGLAVAGIMTCTTTLIADYYEGTKRNRVMGFQVATTYFGGVVFLIVGGALAEINWNYPFLIYVLAFVFLPGVILFLYEPEIVRQSTEKQELEKEQRFPYLSVIIGYFVMFIFMIMYYAIPTQIPFYLTNTITDLNEIQIGIALSAATLFAGIISFSYKYLKKWLSHEILFILSFLLIGSGYIILKYAITYWVFLVGLALSGLGVGNMVPNINIWTVKDTPERYRGRALSMLTSILFLGAFLSPIVNSPIIEGIGYSNIFLIGGIVFFVLILVPLALYYVEHLKKRKTIS